ncbi:uncharacterized protein [Primulina eburnea]|uniref:uncharacterized protein isoform X3 n=1 Tax=Primulina eburnea TaxID=1245227 RepID=UPI003C6C443D
MLSGSGLPRGVRGCPFSLLQRRNCNQTPPVPQSTARALDMLIRSSKENLKLSGSVTWIHQGQNFLIVIVNWRHGKLKPYAVVWIDSKNKCSSRVDDEGDTSPYWDQKLTIPFDSSIEDSTLYIDIVHADADEGTKPLIGSAKLHLRDVVDDVDFGYPADRKLELKRLRPSGRPHGKLEVKVSVREPRYRPAPDPYQPPPYGVPPPGSRDFAPAPPYGNPFE